MSSRAQETNVSRLSVDKSRILLNFAVKHFNCFMQSQNTGRMVMETVLKSI